VADGAECAADAQGEPMRASTANGRTAVAESEAAQPDTAKMQPLQYQPNPKHKPLPTPGRHGSICPKDVNAQALLLGSEVYGKKRYATNGLDAFCAQCHDVDHNLWHGYPVSWAEVPPRIRTIWVKNGTVARRTIRQDWRRRA
jgi:cytochrome c peroxidase